MVEHFHKHPADSPTDSAAERQKNNQTDRTMETIAADLHHGRDFNQMHRCANAKIDVPNDGPGKFVPSLEIVDGTKVLTPTIDKKAATTPDAPAPTTDKKVATTPDAPASTTDKKVATTPDAPAPTTDYTTPANKIADDVAGVLNGKPEGSTLDIEKVKNDMTPSLREFATNFLGKRLKMTGYLTAQTDCPPANQPHYAAQVTKPYENRVMDILTGRDKDIKLTDAQREHLSQKDFASIVAQVCPDRQTTALTLCNLTKNIAALSRGADPKTQRDGVQKLNDRTYNTGDAKKVEHMLEPMNKADEGHDKMGPMYHFYGALAATYINGVVGQALVEGEKYTHGWRGVRHMPSKEAANTAGERAGLQLTTTGHKFRDGLSNALKAELTMLTPILVW